MDRTFWKADIVFISGNKIDNLLLASCVCINNSIALTDAT